MSISLEIQRLQQSKDDLKNSIQSKGVQIPSNEKINNYYQYINQIQVGIKIGGLVNLSFKTSSRNATKAIVVFEDGTTQEFSSQNNGFNEQLPKKVIYIVSMGNNSNQMNIESGDAKIMGELKYNALFTTTITQIASIFGDCSISIS